MTFNKIIFLSFLSIFVITCPIKSKSSINDSKKEKLWNDMAIQVNSWTDKLGMPIDSKIKDTVIVLNLLGFKTLQSCEGHLDHGCASPWVDFDKGDALEKEIILKNIERNQKQIEEKEEELTKKYPNMNLQDIYDSEWVSLYKQYHALWRQIDILNYMKISKLNDLLSKFYKTHFIEYDCVLIISGDRLQSIGNGWQVVRDEKMKINKLKEYQDEMQLFTKFLKDYYWNEFNIN